jgi:signal transduction histidine kinase
VKGSRAIALGLTVAGELEILLRTEDGRLASALALPLVTVPLAWGARRPLLPLLAAATGFAVQAPFGGALVGELLVPLVALLLALYVAGRHARDLRMLGVAIAAAVAVSAVRVAYDPAVERPADALLTLVAVLLPLLVGWWVRGQAELQGRLTARSRRLVRDRDRAARQAAEEERVRIAADLQAAIAGGLDAIAAQAGELPGRLREGDADGARALFGSTSAIARGALADVRRVLGILRRDGQGASRSPHDPDPLARFTVHRPAAPATAVDPPRPPLLAPRTGDLLVAGGVLAGGALELGLGEGAAAAFTAVPVALPLLLRRRAAVPGALLVVAGIALQSLLVDPASFPLSCMAAVVCAAYAVGAHAGRTASVAGLALFAGAVVAHAAVVHPDGVLAALLGGVTAPWTIGRIVRGHRRLTRQSREDALGAERSRAQEERAAVTEERVRIARELHDAVAHNISVIAIQAGGAQGIVDRDPGRAAEVAGLVEAVAREASGELHRLAGALRTGEGPKPTLARVDALATRARAAGQSVELCVEGTAAQLPVGVDLAAYRIVQEALANAAKHAATAHARVTVRYEPAAVEVEIADDGGGGDAPRHDRDGGGHGLVGIRERVGLYGGTLDLGPRPDGGGFRVRARIPVGRP